MPRSVKKEGERCSRHRSRSPLWPVVRTMVKQDVPLQPMEYHGGAGFHAAARGGDHGGAGGPSPTLWPVEDPCQSRFRAGPVAHGEETMQEQVTWQELLPIGDPGWSSLLLRDGPRGVDPYLEQFLKSCCLWAAHNGSFGKDCIPWEGPHSTGNKSD